MTRWYRVRHVVVEDIRHHREGLGEVLVLGAHVPPVEAVENGETDSSARSQVLPLAVSLDSRIGLVASMSTSRGRKREKSAPDSTAVSMTFDIYLEEIDRLLGDMGGADVGQSHDGHRDGPELEPLLFRAARRRLR